MKAGPEDIGLVEGDTVGAGKIDERSWWLERSNNAREVGN